MMFSLVATLPGHCAPLATHKQHLFSDGAPYGLVEKPQLSLEDILGAQEDRVTEAGILTCS